MAEWASWALDQASRNGEGERGGWAQLTRKIRDFSISNLDIFDEMEFPKGIRDEFQGGFGKDSNED
jgi:hypothetical protein